MLSSGSRIAIIGTGYVGMACAIGFAQMGHEVAGYDVLAERVRELRRGSTPYREEGIVEALHRHLESGKLTFHEELAPAIRGADAIVVAVGTPSRADGSADLSALEAVTRALRRVDLGGALVVLRSTVPPGTSDWLASELRGRARVVYAPEFLREGSAVGDFLDPDRIVVGAEDSVDAQRYARLLAALDRPVIATSRCEAELVKNYSNAYLAMKISFANEVANLSDALGADAAAVLRGIGGDTRIGPAFLAPGIGFGGPCFEKDLKSLRRTAERNGVASRLIDATLVVNDAQPTRFVDMLERELGTLNGTHIAVWGVTFKAGTDDVRNSLAPRVIEALLRRGARVVAYDPTVDEAQMAYGAIIAKSPLEALRGCDALAVLTEWPAFRDVDPQKIALAVRRGVVADGRNVLDGEALAALGIRYCGIGRHAFPLDVTDRDGVAREARRGVVSTFS